MNIYKAPNLIISPKRNLCVSGVDGLSPHYHAGGKTGLHFRKCHRLFRTLYGKNWFILFSPPPTHSLLTPSSTPHEPAYTYLITQHITLAVFWTVNVHCSLRLQRWLTHEAFNVWSQLAASGLNGGREYWEYSYSSRGCRKTIASCHNEPSIIATLCASLLNVTRDCYKRLLRLKRFSEVMNYSAYTNCGFKNKSRIGMQE